MSCRVASLPCCCRCDVEVHLRRKHWWVQLSTHSYLIRTKMTPRRKKCWCGSSTVKLVIYSYSTRSAEMSLLLSLGSRRMYNDDCIRKAGVSVVLVLRYCTFLTGESDPAVQAAAAAVASVALRPVLTLAGLRTVRPKTIRSAVWNRTSTASENYAGADALLKEKSDYFWKYDYLLSSGETRKCIPLLMSMQWIW